MKVIDVRGQITMYTGESKVEILLTAKIDGILDEFPYNLTINDIIIVNKHDLDKKLFSLEKEHPFFMLKLCESPIEVTFFVFALADITGLRPQVWVGEYRVDFALPEKRVAIELDGHNFHSTKEQRTNDAKRERYLLRQGWRTMRFTGSEIHNDVMGCIREAGEIINTLPTL